MKFFGRDDEDVDGDDSPGDARESPPSDEPIVATDSIKPSFRIAGPMVLLEKNSPTISSQQAKKPLVVNTDTVEENGGKDLFLKLHENVTPIARLRNPRTYNASASD